MTQSRKKDPYELPILVDAVYRCSCGYAADMDWFYGDPEYAHYMHYAIRCRNILCNRNKVTMFDWQDAPSKAIRAWNRRCLELEQGGSE